MTSVHNHLDLTVIVMMNKYIVQSRRNSTKAFLIIIIFIRIIIIIIITIMIIIIITFLMHSVNPTSHRTLLIKFTTFEQLQGQSECIFIQGSSLHKFYDRNYPLNNLLLCCTKMTLYDPVIWTVIFQFA